MDNLTTSKPEYALMPDDNRKRNGDLTSNAINVKPKSVLVVDDEEELRDGFCIDLQASGYEVLTASNGREAIETLKKHGNGIHLIISDEKMPIMCGYDFCREVKSNPAWWPIPFVFLTARIGEDHFLEGYKLGASDYLQKPYNNHKMLAVVERRIADYQVLLEHRADELEQERLTTIEQMARGVIHDLTGVLTELGFGGVVQEFLDQIRDEVMSGICEGDQRNIVLVAVGRIHDHCDDLKNAIDLGIGLLEGLQSLCHGHGEERTLQMLGDIVKIPIGLLQHKIEMQGITMECDLAPVLMECRKRDLVQVVLNLIRNSMHALEASAKKLLSVRLWEDEKNIFLQITDTGCGIPPENQARIFDWGFTTKVTGKGIGMPTIKRIVEAHDGSVRLESKINQGTSMTVSFPAYREKE